MPGLPAVGQLTYNGFTFDGAANIAVEVSFVQDEAQRTVLYLRHEITVDTVITPDSSILNGTSTTSTDDVMSQIQQLLSKQGGILVFRNKGFRKPLIVNRDIVRDVKWGPQPKIVSWDPIGSSSACHVVWKVVTCIPDCPDAKYSGVMAMNYSMTFDINDLGDTERKITGYLEIAQTWQGNAALGTNRTPPDSADRYRSFITASKPKGYKRKTSWDLSKDKSRLDFTITDTQIPTRNPYPPHCANIDGRHVVSWRLGNGRAGAFIENSIDVSITPNRGIGGTQAWLIFFNIAKKRLDHATAQGKTWLAQDLTVEEDLFGRPCSFHLSYRFVGLVKDLLADSGLWRPIGTNWDAWEATMTQTYYNRGNDLLSHQPAQDAIIDLCGAGTSSNNSPQANEPAKTITKKVFKNDRPTPESSWMSYEAEVIIEENNQTVQHVPIQETPEHADYPANIPTMLKSTGHLAFPLTNSAPAIIQQRGAPSYRARFRGMAVRAGYPIPRPALLSIGGQKAVATVGRFICKVTGNALGLPVFAAAWDIPYVLAGSPGEVQPPDKVDEQVTGGGIAFKPQ